MIQKRCHRLRTNRGITLLEILITVFVLTFGIMSSLLYFTTALNSTRMARELTVATTHGEFIMEDLFARSTRAALLNAVESTDWQAWGSTQFGINSVLPSALPAETYSVSVADNTADPLAITTVIAWQHRGATNNVTFNAELTKP